MPARGTRGPVHERRIEDFVQDDPDDSDFENTAPRSAKKRRSTHKPQTKTHKRSKRPRRSYSDDDVVDDSEDLETEESFSDEEEPEHIDVNPTTGRPRRGIVSHSGRNYAESDNSSLPEESDLESGGDVQDSDDELAKPATPRKTRRRLVVKLKIPDESLALFEEQADGKARKRMTRSSSVRATSEARMTRASARLSEEPEQLMELTASGHARPVATKGLARTGGKGLKGVQPAHPSTILEESRRESEAPEAEATEERHDPTVESIEERNTEVTQTGTPEAHGEASVDDSDGEPVLRRRPQRTTAKPSSQHRSQSRSQKNKRSESEDDYDPENGESSEIEAAKVSSGPNAKRKRASSEPDSMGADSDASEDIDDDELMAEVEELGRSRRNKRPRITRNYTDPEIQFDAPTRARRARPSNINYNLLPDDVLRIDEQSDDGRPTSRAPARTAPKYGARGLFSMSGPFGGTSHVGKALPFGPDARGAALMGDDSSDDDVPARQPNPGPGLTPLTPHVAAAAHNADASGPMGFGRVTKKDMADITPLGIAPDIGFDSVGGLDDHIDKLKEMVMLPLLYPELYSKWKVPPPRGVLFHGPPGTGKTLLARALASSVSIGSKKVTFFMRKGADVMSKWVGEAERQLRLLFEEAKKQQPAIIFFDEFDGLAPVRSSKQEQIHASIVTTLLSLMDGMDSRGQIVVIGATNRPDSIDSAFRRPGRFDREFYFPLPNLEARRAIIDIHTREWEPALTADLKHDLAERTRGYGGSDLRALCTEAIINAVQRTYPQIYRSDKKLDVDTSSIKVIAKDFLLSMRKIVPSSERSTTAVADPLPKKIEPLLRLAYKDIVRRLDEVVPSRRKHLTALEEAELEDVGEGAGFDAEEMMRAFERGRIFRPRLLLKGRKGMGQKYLAAAALQHLESFFVRNLDLATLFGDAANPPEAVLSSAFKEARTHQPSILFIPQINIWYETVGPRVVETFSSLLRTLAANDAVLLLGVMEGETLDEEPEPRMMRDLFGFSQKHEYRLEYPTEDARLEFFSLLTSYIRKRPSEFADQENRKKRVLPQLPLAKEEFKVKAPPSKEELKAQYKADRSTLNILRIVLTPTMREVKDKWRIFNKSVIADRDIDYLLQERDPDFVTSDLTEQQRQEQQNLRPFEFAKDKHGNQGLRDTATNRFFYNCNTQIIEQRLSNGYYKRSKEFLYDLKTIVKDQKMLGFHDKIMKANDMYGFAMAECEAIEMANPQLILNAEAVYQRELEREKLRQAEKGENNLQSANVPRPAPDSTIPSGPVVLGEPIGLGIPQTAAGNLNNHTENHTNGVVDTSRANDHIADAMDMDDPSSGSRPQFPTGYTETPSNPTTYQQSQQSDPLHRPKDSTVAKDVRNSTSTTTSGNKTSNRTSRSSDPRRHTQSTNGNSTQADSLPPDWTHPYFDSLQGPPEGSQLPDTQSTDSKRQTVGTTSSFVAEPHRHMSNGTAEPSEEQDEQDFKHPGLPASLQAHVQAAADSSKVAPPGSMIATHGSIAQDDTSASRLAASQTRLDPAHVHTAPIADILNPTPPSPPLPPFVLDENELQSLHRWMSQSTNNLTVEQLEMIDARCMFKVWQARGEWNRNPVVAELRLTVQEVLEDVAWQGELSTAVAADYIAGNENV